MRVAVIGSRSCAGFSVSQMIPFLPTGCSEIVSGGAVGIDSIAQAAAHVLDVPIKIFLPKFEIYGKSAPLRRNLEIIEYSDLVLAFWDMRSNGTKQVIAECIRRRKPFRIIPIEPKPKHGKR